MRHGEQPKLFDLPQELPNGLIYQPNFLTEAEEEYILEVIRNLPLKHPQYDEYMAKRRIMNFGWGYDFEHRKLIPGPPLPDFLQDIQEKIAGWIEIPAPRVAEALISEYTEGSAIGWHRDTEEFEMIVGISLAGWCRMRFRPVPGRSPDSTKKKKDVVALEVEPRSAYIMQGPVRWDWQHSIAPTRTLRYSITFRTLPEGII